MPKRASIFLAVVALALSFAACNGSPNVTPTPAPSGTITPNPKDRSASVDVTILGTPAPHVAVQISTPKSSASPRPGTPFATQYTKKSGTTIFYGLNPKKTYCWVALLSSSQTSSTCAQWYIWQTSPITLGT